MNKMPENHFSTTVNLLLTLMNDAPEKADGVIVEAFEKGYLTFDTDSIKSMPIDEIINLNQNINILLDFISGRKEVAQENLNKIKTYQKARTAYGKYA